MRSRSTRVLGCALILLNGAGVAGSFREQPKRGGILDWEREIDTFMKRQLVTPGLSEGKTLSHFTLGNAGELYLRNGGTEPR